MGSLSATGVLETFAISVSRSKTDLAVFAASAGDWPNNENVFVIKAKYASLIFLVEESVLK